MNLGGCLTSCLTPPTHGRGKEGRGLGGESQQGMHSVQEWKLHESRGLSHLLVTAVLQSLEQCLACSRLIIIVCSLENKRQSQD